MASSHYRGRVFGPDLVDLADEPWRVGTGDRAAASAEPSAPVVLSDLGDPVALAAEPPATPMPPGGA